FARQHCRDPFRRPSGSSVRPAWRNEPRRRRADDRDSGVARSEDTRQPHGRGAPGARAGAVRAAPPLRRRLRRRQTHHRTIAPLPSTLRAPLRVTVLGSGPSLGVPAIGCECAVCHSSDPRDRRTRPSILIEVNGTSILLDTSTDLRMQALAHDIRRVDAILFTHNHADHVFGLDDVLRFNQMQRSAISCYADAPTVISLRRVFSYVFDPTVQPGGGLPQLTLFSIAGPFCLAGVEIVPVPLMHGRLPILGFRIGSFAYLTDCNQIPDVSWPLLTA